MTHSGQGAWKLLEKQVWGWIGAPVGPGGTAGSRDVGLESRSGNEATGQQPDPRAEAAAGFWFHGRRPLSLAGRPHDCLSWGLPSRNDQEQPQTQFTCGREWVAVKARALGELGVVRTVQPERASGRHWPGYGLGGRIQGREELSRPLKLAPFQHPFAAGALSLSLRSGPQLGTSFHHHWPLLSASLT